MGHHMGSASRDFFLELSYLFPEKGARISLSLDQEKHNLSDPISEAVNELMLSGTSLVSEHLEVSASFGYGRIENPGNAVGPTRSVNEIATKVRYVF